LLASRRELAATVAEINHDQTFGGEAVTAAQRALEDAQRRPLCLVSDPGLARSGRAAQAKATA
jgi:hypothetical protein